uniref:Uncharacterized protein n=1 Tax=viral metagenome TaxID=1070528 RepID=A0A6M3JEB5_9ZZZZ
MSEYTCAEGHRMNPGWYRCPKCGGRITYEDGMNEKEMMAEPPEECEE